jgi:hypothetical protein
MCNTWLNVKPCDSCFLFPLDQSFFSIIIVTWNFCFPSVNPTIFLFRKCCHIFDITEFRKKTPCPGPFIAYTSYILLFSRRLSLCLYHHGWVTLLAFTFWQRKCPWHAVCTALLIQIPATWLIINNHQLALSGCNDDCFWMLEYNLRSSSLKFLPPPAYHYCHSVIPDFANTSVDLVPHCHKYISDCCTGYCSSINSFITDSIEKKKFDVISSSVVWSVFSSVLIGFLLTKISDLAAVTRLGL